MGPFEASHCPAIHWQLWQRGKVDNHHSGGRVHEDSLLLPCGVRIHSILPPPQSSDKLMTLALFSRQSEYPPRFRAWNVNKRIEKDVKDDITSALGRRKRPGTSTSQVIIHQSDRNKPFDVKKLKRHLMDKGRSRPVEVLAPGL